MFVSFVDLFENIRIVDKPIAVFKNCHVFDEEKKKKEKKKGKEKHSDNNRQSTGMQVAVFKISHPLSKIYLKIQS